jgi:hypothetical protein
MSKNETEYATIQIRKSVKDHITDHCNSRGYKIGRLMENLYKQYISGSAPTGSFTFGNGR